MSFIRQAVSARGTQTQVSSQTEHVQRRCRLLCNSGVVNHPIPTCTLPTLKSRREGCLIDRHPIRHGAQLMTLARRVVVRRVTPSILPTLRLRHLSRLNVRRKPLLEIHHHHNRRPDRDDQQQDGKYGERSQHATPPRVLRRALRVPHAEQLEDKVGHGGEVEGDDEYVAGVGFSSHEDCREDEEADDDGERGDGEGRLGDRVALDDDQELDGEAEEEEEVELEQGDVDLCGSIVSGTKRRYRWRRMRRT